VFEAVVADRTVLDQEDAVYQCIRPGGGGQPATGSPPTAVATRAARTTSSSSTRPRTSTRPASALSGAVCAPTRCCAPSETPRSPSTRSAARWGTPWDASATSSRPSSICA
jgi:hypothetical protein